MNSSKFQTQNDMSINMHSWITKVSSALQSVRVWHIILEGGLIFFVFVIAMAFVQFATPDMPDNDGYYHIRFARLMAEEGLKPTFRWLPLTILNAREFSDHHFLFHVLLIPFSSGDLRAGAKWAAVIFASFAFLCIWWLLKHQRVPNAMIWSLGILAVSEAFIYRMSITRAQSLSLAVLVLGMHWMLTKKYYRLLPLSFLYVWLYDAFPLLIVLGGIYVISKWVIDGEFNLNPLIYAGIGSVFGLLVNPYFPDNVIFFIRHLAPKLNEATAVSVGSEWYPYQTTQLMQNSPLAIIYFLVGCLALGLLRDRMDSKTLMGFLAAIVFGVMLFQSRRFVEYFPAFALIFAAFAWSPLLEPKFDDKFGDKTQFMTLYSRGWTLWDRVSSEALLGVVILLVIVFAGSWNTLTDARNSIRESKPFELYASASHWLESNTPKGSLIFQTDWDDFPRLFYYNTQNTYLIGLDPTYMQLYDPELYDLWVDITQGKAVNPSGQIYPLFGARHVLTDLKHQSFIRVAEDDPGLLEVYRDEYAIIYEVLEETPDL